MTIRTLPKAKLPSARPFNLQWEVSQSALDRWNPQLRSPESKSGGTDNNVISIMDVIGQDWLGDGITANRVTGALRAIGNEPVTVEINSPGGDFFEGLAIYNALKEHPKTVTVKVLGLAASAASVIAMAGDEILMPRAGFLMIHNTWILAMGDRNALRAAADWLEPFDVSAADIYATRTGIDADEIAKMLDKETWLGGADAVDQGFADDLLPSDQVDSKTKNQSLTGPAAASRRIEVALARGERLPRSERRKLLKEITGTPSAADEDDTPSAVGNAVIDGNSGLRLALAHLTLAGA